MIGLLSDVKDDEEVVFSFTHFDDDDFTDEIARKAHFTRQDVDNSSCVIQIDLKDGTESEIDITSSNPDAVFLFNSIRNLNGSP